MLLCLCLVILSDLIKDVCTSTPFPLTVMAAGYTIVYFGLVLSPSSAWTS